MKPLSILLAGGGTAGHVNPLLATAKQLRQLRPEVQIAVLGTQQGLEKDLVPAAGFELITIDKVPFPRKPNADLIKFPGRFARSLKQVKQIIREREVDCVVGFGGYVCPPAYLAAKRLGVPIVLHEANRKPGLANRLGAKHARVVATAFAGSTLPHARQIGMPMRASVAHLDRTSNHAEAAAHFGLDPNRPILLVTGGSLGAQRLNTAFQDAAEMITAAGAQVLHITGKGKTFPAPHPDYHVLEYVSEMEHAYAAADLAVTRSGAGTVCELTAIGLPAVFVPLPIGNGEQALNGADVVKAEGALMVADADFDTATVTETVLPLLLDEERLKNMSQASRRFGINDAAEVLAQLVLQSAQGE